MGNVASQRRSQDGYILVAVLAVMLLLTSFMAAGSLLVRSALDTARVGDADVTMSGLPQGGLELAAYQLFIIKAAPAAIDGRRIKFGGGTIVAHIYDESGKADLNGSDPLLLAAVFQGVGMDSAIASELVTYIVDIRGRDRTPSTHGAPTASGTELSAVTSQPQQATAKKMLRGFQSVDQLRDFPDLRQADLRALRPLLTVFNPDGKINILSASREMLTDVPGMSSINVTIILASRTEADMKVIDALLSTMIDAKPYLKNTFGPAYTVRVDATSAKGHKKTINAVLAASKSPDDPYYILDWWE